MLDELIALSPAEFEHAVAQLLPHLGFADVRRVGGANDRGVDIVCRDADGSLVAVQCKRYDPSRRVGALAVQHLSAMAFQRRAHRGIFVTTAAFTTSARRQADEFDIELIDGPQLVELLRQFGFGAEVEDRFPASGPLAASLSELCLRDPYGLGLETPFGWGIWESDRIEGPDRPVTRARPRGRWHPMLYDEEGAASRVLGFLEKATPEEFRQAIAIRLVLARRETETAELHGQTVALRSIKRSEAEIEGVKVYLPVAPNAPVQDFVFEHRVDGTVHQEVHRCHLLEARQVVRAADIDALRSDYGGWLAKAPMYYYTNSYFSWEALQRCEAGPAMVLEDAKSIAYDLFAPFGRDFGTLARLSPLSRPQNLIFVG